MHKHKKNYNDYLEAIKEGDNASDLEDLILQDPILDEEDQDHYTLLHWAAFFDRKEVLKKLIRRFIKPSDQIDIEFKGETTLEVIKDIKKILVKKTSRFSYRKIKKTLSEIIALLSDINIFSKLGGRWYRQDAYREAIFFYDRAIKVNPIPENYKKRCKAYLALYKRGSVLNDRELLDKAQLDYSSFLFIGNKEKTTLHIEFAELYFRRGLAYAEIERYREATIDYVRAIKYVKRDIYYFQCSQAYVNLSRPDKARESYKQAISLNPEIEQEKEIIKLHSQIINLEGLLDFAKERYHDAIEKFTLAIELNPSDNVFYFNRCRAYIKSSQPDKGFLDYHKMISLKSEIEAEEEIINLRLEIAHLYFNRALIKVKSPWFWYQGALEDYTKAIELKKDCFEFYFCRCQVYIKLMRFNDALKDYKKIISLSCEMEDKNKIIELRSEIAEQEETVVNSEYEYEDNDIYAIVCAGISHIQPNVDYILYPLPAVDNIVIEQLADRLREEMHHNGGQKRCVLIPFNYVNYHWAGIGIVINIEGEIERAEYFDSLTPESTIPEVVLQQLRVVYPSINISTKHLLQQADGTSCGAYMIENLFLFAKQETPQTCSNEEIRNKDIRHKHLAWLKQYDPNFYREFYIRQLDNRPTVADTGVLSDYLNRLRVVRFTPREKERIYKVRECLNNIHDVNSRDTLWQALQPKEEYQGQEMFHLTEIRQALKQAADNLSDITDKEQLRVLISLLFGIQWEISSPFPDLTDADFRISYEEIKVVGSNSNVDSQLEQDERAKIQAQIQRDEELARQLQEEFNRELGYRSKEDKSKFSKNLEVKKTLSDELTFWNLFNTFKDLIYPFGPESVSKIVGEALHSKVPSISSETGTNIGKGVYWGGLSLVVTASFFNSLLDLLQSSFSLSGQNAGVIDFSSSFQSETEAALASYQGELNTSSTFGLSSYDVSKYSYFDEELRKLRENLGYIPERLPNIDEIPTFSKTYKKDILEYPLSDSFGKIIESMGELYKKVNCSPNNLYQYPLPEIDENFRNLKRKKDNVFSYSIFTDKSKDVTDESSEFFLSQLAKFQYMPNPARPDFFPLSTVGLEHRTKPARLELTPSPGAELEHRSNYRRSELFQPSAAKLKHRSWPAARSELSPPPPVKLEHRSNPSRSELFQSPPAKLKHRSWPAARSELSPPPPVKLEHRFNPSRSELFQPPAAKLKHKSWPAARSELTPSPSSQLEHQVHSVRPESSPLSPVSYGNFTK